MSAPRLGERLGRLFADTMLALLEGLLKVWIALDASCARLSALRGGLRLVHAR